MIHRERVLFERVFTQKVTFDTMYEKYIEAHNVGKIYLSTLHRERVVIKSVFISKFTFDTVYEK